MLERGKLDWTQHVSDPYPLLLISPSLRFTRCRTPNPSTYHGKPTSRGSTTGSPRRPLTPLLPLTEPGLMSPSGTILWMRPRGCLWLVLEVARLPIT